MSSQQRRQVACRESSDRRPKHFKVVLRHLSNISEARLKDRAFKPPRRVGGLPLYERSNGGPRWPRPRRSLTSTSMTHCEVAASERRPLVASPKPFQPRVQSHRRRLIGSPISCTQRQTRFASAQEADHASAPRPPRTRRGRVRQRRRAAGSQLERERSRGASLCRDAWR